MMTDEQQTPSDTLEGVRRLTRDLKKAALTLSADEARFLVDYYYQIQEDRIRSTHQVRTLMESQEPHDVLAWLGSQTATLENQIKRALDAYTDASPVGQWSKSLCGIGPIIAAGLLAHIDITKAPTVGHIWRFAGLDPSVKWAGADDCAKAITASDRAVDAELVASLALDWGRTPEALLRSATTDHKTGEVVTLTKARLARALARRPWNTSLKTLCWKIGESFVKVSGNESDVYGKLYLERKAREIARNDAGELAGQAAEKLAKYNIGKGTDARKHYEMGRLPPAHIHARAKRWAVKLFLAHWHHVAYMTHFGTPPPKPYVLTLPNHTHEIPVPNWPMRD